MLLVAGPAAALEDLEPDRSDTARDELITALNLRDRPLYGGQVITLGKFQASRTIKQGTLEQGGELIHQSSGGVAEAFHGTLGVLLEDAADPHVGYAVTALHVLEEFADKHLGRSRVEAGDPVFQYRGDVARLPSSQDHIGWVVAWARALDAVLIGLRPNRRWRPEVLVAPGTPVVTKRGDFVFPDYADPAHGTAANSHRWGSDFSVPNRNDLPATGPAVSKTGARTGHTTGSLYWNAHGREDPPFVDQIEKPPTGSTAPHAAWDEVVRFYTGVVDDQRQPLDLGDDKYNPPRYLCVPDTTGLGPGVVSFAQKGDSGAPCSTPIIASSVCSARHLPERATSPNSDWVGAVLVPIQIVIAALEDEFRLLWDPGKPGVPWPELLVPDAADIPPQPLDRRVPGGLSSPSSNPGWMQIIEHQGKTLPTSAAA